MTIRRIRIAEVRVPLPHVIVLGTTRISTRDYVVLRLETERGLAGEAVGYARGTPLFDALQQMAPRVLNADALWRRALVEELRNASVPGRASLVRAISLVDIACWDLTAKSAGLPLHQLLGGCRPDAPVTAVGGYYLDRRADADVVDEVRGLAGEGFHRVKVMMDGQARSRDHGLLSQLAALGGRLAADAHWSWSTLAEASRYWTEMDSLGLDFLEDPFAASDVSLTLRLQEKLVTPIAAGEDVPEPRALQQLAGGIGVLRVDATTCGGITGALAAIHHADGAGCQVLPHVFAPLHVELACALPAIESVEFIPAASGADPLEALCDFVPPVRGRMPASHRPGAGIVLKWGEFDPFISRAAELSDAGVVN